MSNSAAFDLNDWLSRWDMEAVAGFDDKVKECEFFYSLLSSETDRNRFRWLVSAFLNSAYSFFESTALIAHFWITDPVSGDSHPDHERLKILKKYVKVSQRKNNPNFVDTQGLAPITKSLYKFRKENTHHFPLSIMAAGPNLPEDFHFGSMKNEGTPVVPLCREALELVKKVFSEING